MRHVKHSSFGLYSDDDQLIKINRNYFSSAIDKQLNSSIARNYALLSMFNVALFRSSSAFINNSFSMYTLLLAYTCWFSNALSVREIFDCSCLIN